MELFPPDYNPLDHELNFPSYSRNVPSKNTTGHVYTLTHGGSHNRLWAILKLMSAAPSPNILPVLVEGEQPVLLYSNIWVTPDGYVQATRLLGLSSSTSSQRVLSRYPCRQVFLLGLSFKMHVNLSKTIGRVMYSEMATDDFIGQQGIFLNQSQVIWSPTMGDSKSGSSKKEAHLFTEKLHGQYSWPFKLTLPRHITGKTVTSDTSTFNLPATFGEKNAKISINYEVHVCTQKGKLHPGIE